MRNIMLSLFACLILFFGCININQEQDVGAQPPDQKPPKPPVQKPPKINDSQDTEPEADPTAPPTNVTPVPMPIRNITTGSENGSGFANVVINKSKIKINVGKNKTNVDLYDFLNDKPNLGGIKFPTDEEECKDKCDDVCSNQAAGCEISCNSVFVALCADASVHASVCQSSCAAIPPPFNIPCSNQCEEAFEAACNEDDLQQCKDDCQNLHYNICTDDCYKDC
jgi:hypothetical protein